MAEKSDFRGPDNFDLYVDDKVSLAHNLLNISAPDPEYGKQPWHSRKGNILLFNGEIYSYQGFDTGYLAEMLDFHGIDYLKNINGAFAIAWYEPEKNLITLARDHYGQKPLYYIMSDELTFSSSIHSLKSDFELCEQSYHLFLGNDRFWNGYRTLYKNIYKLCPGEYISYDVVKKRIVSKGSLFDFSLETHDKSDDDIREVIRSGILDVTNTKQKQALLLSGGLDSTTILNCMKKDNMFAISSAYEPHMEEGTVEKYFDEADYAQQSAKLYNVPWHECYITRNDIETKDKESLRASRMPMFDDFRFVPRYLTYKKAAELEAKVIYSGDCGDEIFTGYTGDWYLYKKNMLDIKERVERKEFLADWFPSHVFGKNKVANFCFYRMLTQGEGFNLVSDSLASYFSMESRTPFCHQNLVKTILELPTEHKLKMPEGWYKGTYKYLLREVFKNELPKHITEKDIKTGWASPWNSRDDYINRQNAIKNVKLCI